MSTFRSSFLSMIDIEKTKMKPYEGFIFLCGGPTDIESPAPISVRDAIYRELAQDENIEKRVRLAEHYKDWAHNSVYNDLVLFENHIAELSSVVVLVLESPGAIAELGLFSTIEGFQNKLLVLIENSHYAANSFIKLGPIDYLEKLHGNTVNCYRWLKVVSNKSIFDSNAAEAIQDEIVESINVRLIQPLPEQNFSHESWLHFALLICDFINLASALTVREIRDNLNFLGINKTESEVKQALFLLERLNMLIMEPRGDQRFYISIEDRLFFRFSITDSTLDLHRFRIDHLAEYEKNDKKRFRAIQATRAKS